MPVASAVPSRITAQPATIAGVRRSARNSAPHSTANAGTRKVTEIAFDAPAWAISRKYSR